MLDKHESTDSADYEAYLQQYPNGNFAALARVRKAAAEEARRREAERVGAELEAAKHKTAEVAFWNTIMDSTRAADFEAYLRRYPDGEFASLALIRQAEAQREANAEREAQRAIDRIAGEWTTTFGKLSLTRNAEGVIGSYSGTLFVSGGRITGSVQESVLTGFWLQERRCPYLC